MINGKKMTNSDHQKVSLLLPWYVNKTLDDNDKDFVENHISACLVCRIELTNLQKLSAFVRQEDVADSAAHAAFSQLKNRIHQDETLTKQRTGMVDSFFDFWREKIGFNRKKLLVNHPGLVLASVMTFVFLLLIPGFFGKNLLIGNQFQTLSNTKHEDVGKNEIRVVFASGMSSEQISGILDAYQGRIVSGPTSQGVLNVRIGNAEKQMTKQQITEIISKLRNNPQVIFAEPSYAMFSQNNLNPG